MRENEGNGGTGERSLLKKLRKTFIWDGLGYSLCKSVCASILFRPFPEKIVRERLREHPPSTGSDCGI